MRLREITEGVGRITKQNQTVDVGPDEVTKQAAKFGNKVDKDGRPPTLSKKVKGKSTNVLFNLGLAEGYKLQLERDKEMLVLNITDTATGKRTEVRGKPGYETNYDPNDSLHILLDKVGKSANISDLMNGEVVGINPKHPDADRAKAATDRAYSENFASATKQDIIAFKKFVKGVTYLFKNYDNMSEEEQDELVAELIKLQFDSNLMNSFPKWKAYVIKNAEKMFSEMDPEDYEKFQKIFRQAGLIENFADGKKKGKSRPGRVKRSGASCNGSVTALRKRAKNASGEKAKMYHWCANMKSGRKKK